tara:strand:+ start:1145 stop:1264 length:120 start_codon:yes stop_codon:yes gene_type:complete
MDFTVIILGVIGVGFMAWIIITARKEANNISNRSERRKR